MVRYFQRNIRLQEREDIIVLDVGVGYLLPMNQRDKSTVVEVDSKSLRLTHLSKVMFPEDGFTKAELLLYYQTVAPLLLPHLRGRPLTLKAFPNGVKERP